MTQFKAKTNILVGDITIHRHSLEDLDGDPNGMTFYGADGKSAYQLAVDNGFKGTEDEWFEFLLETNP